MLNSFYINLDKLMSVILISYLFWIIYDFVYFHFTYFHLLSSYIYLIYLQLCNDLFLYFI